MRIVAFLALFVLASCSDDKSISPTPLPSAAAKMGADVSFADRNLELLVRWALKKPEGRITSDELAALNSLDANNRLDPIKQPIRKLAGIQHCTGLDTLLLWGHQITDISPLAGLSELRRLDLGENQVSDASPLAELTELRHLSLWGNQVVDLRPLSSLTKLEKLYLRGNGITDVRPLAGLTRLKQLELGNNEIENVRPLNGLENLDWLGLVGNPIRQSQIAQQLPALVEKDVRISVRTPGPSSPVATEPEPEPEPPEPEPEEVPGELPVDVSNLYVGDPWWLQFGNTEGLSVRSLPSWLSFDEATGRIEGTPTQAGTYEFVVDRGDGFTERYLLIVAGEVPDRFPRTFILGQSHGIGLIDNPPAGVRPLAFTIEGDLPPGFSFDPEIAQIDGTPEATGTFDFDYVVTDANGEEVYREEFRYVVITDPSSTQPPQEPEPPLDFGLALGVEIFYGPSLEVGRSVNYTFPAAINGVEPITYSLSGVPPGLSFDAATRRLSGVPTTPAGPEEIMTFMAIDNSGVSGSVLFSAEVEHEYINLSDGYVGRLFSVSYSKPIYFPSSVSGPSWLEYDPTTGIISGTPPSAGRYTYRANFSDGSWTSHVILVHDELPDRETTTEVLGRSYHWSFEKSCFDGPAPFTIRIEGTLPPGLSFSQTEESATFEGTFEETGTFDFDYVTTDANGEDCGENYIRLVVTEAP